MKPVPVAVCLLGTDHCVSVVVVGYCQCYAGTDDERIIDLSRIDFADLADPGDGKVDVEVRR